jgi:CRP/FNR family transcriptional regulator, cyclic AMP receptor protein
MNSLEKNEGQPSCEFQENLNLLRQTYFFSGMPLESLKVFAYLCTRDRFKEGEYLFHQNEDDAQAFYLIEGAASLERRENGTTRHIRSYSAGAFIGGLTLLGEMRRPFSLKATQNTLCLILTREKFSKAIGQFSDHIPKVFRALVERIGIWEENFLTHQAEKCDGCLENLGVSLL